MNTQTSKINGNQIIVNSSSTNDLSENIFYDSLYNTLYLDYENVDSNYDITISPSRNLLTVAFPEVNNEQIVQLNGIDSFVVTAGEGNNFILIGDGYWASHAAVFAGGGNDWIYVDKGHNYIDGGTGLDVLSLDFSHSRSPVTYLMDANDSGKYLADDGATQTEFHNIEAFNIIGSHFDDELVAMVYDQSAIGAAFSGANPVIDGSDGYDKLTIDYSTQNNLGQDFGVYSYSGNLTTYNYDTRETNTLQVRNIEAFDLTVGAGNNRVDLGYDNYTNDTIKTGAGNDEIVAGKGIDVIDGGEGYDVITVNFSNSFTPLISDIQGGNGTYQNGEGTQKVTVNQMEAISGIGSSYDDLILGLPGVDTIFGYNGADTINGKSGNDFLSGSRGNDTIFGGGGHDKLYGNADDDRLYGNHGRDLLQGNTGDDLLSGGYGNDTLYGGDGDDTLGGGNGKDKINGDAGNDRLFGGNNNDTIMGNDGNDTLVGGNGDDILVGGNGRDILFGKEGADIFVIESGSDRVNIVKDFTPGEDKIGLDFAYNFEDLNIVSNWNGSLTLIRQLSAGNQILVGLTGIEPNVLSSEDFIYYAYES